MSCLSILLLLACTLSWSDDGTLHRKFGAGFSQLYQTLHDQPGYSSPQQVQTLHGQIMVPIEKDMSATLAEHNSQKAKLPPLSKRHEQSA